jgi:hypothetical protein
VREGGREGKEEQREGGRVREDSQRGSSVGLAEMDGERTSACATDLLLRTSVLPLEDYWFTTHRIVEV